MCLGQTNVKTSGRQDLNLRPTAPKAAALPSCATSRSINQYIMKASSRARTVEFRVSYCCGRTPTARTASVLRREGLCVLMKLAVKTSARGRQPCGLRAPGGVLLGGARRVSCSCNRANLTRGAVRRLPACAAERFPQWARRLVLKS